MHWNTDGTSVKMVRAAAGHQNSARARGKLQGENHLSASSCTNSQVIQLQTALLDANSDLTETQTRKVFSKSIVYGHIQ